MKGAYMALAKAKADGTDGVGAGAARRRVLIVEDDMLVGMGLGLSLLPAMAHAADTDPTRVYRPLRGRPLTRTLVAIWHRDRYRTQAARQFARALRDAARSDGDAADAK